MYLYIFFLFSFLQTSSIHGRPRSTSMRTATPLHPGTWRVSLVAALPSSSSHPPPQLTPAAWLIVTTPWTTTFMVMHAPPPTSLAPLRATPLRVSTAAPHAAPSTLSAWWCLCPCLPQTTQSLVALSLVCTMVVALGTAAETLPVEETPETTEVPHTVAAARWTGSQPICWTSLKSRCRCTGMVFTHCSTNAQPPRPPPRSSATKAPDESDTWSTLYKNFLPSHTP